MTLVLIYDIVRFRERQYKAHYRLYNENRVLVKDGDYVYTIKKIRRMTPSLLRAKVVTGIYGHLVSVGVIEKGTSYRSECLTPKDALKIEMQDFAKPKKDDTIVKTFAKKVEVEDNPRIYRVVSIDGHPTIVKSDKTYLTREQAKDLLFEKQLGGN